MEGSEEEMVFNQGKSSKEKGEDKKKVGRRSITKAKEVSRKTSVVGKGDNKKGVSDVYKEYYEEENKSNGIFYFMCNLLIHLTLVFDCDLSYLESSPKHNLTSSCNGSPSCALVKKYMTSEFAEA
ncbi:hypothetical protein Tco_0527794 [Tanacetum coccineum]